MGNLGLQEIILIGIIALVFLGPEKFPTYAKIAIRAYRDLRSYFEDTKRDITREFNPLRKEFDEMSRHRPEDIIDRLVGPAKKELEGAAKEIDAALKEADAVPANGKETPPSPGPDTVDQVPGTQPASKTSNRTEYGDYSD